MIFDTTRMKRFTLWIGGRGSFYIYATHFEIHPAHYAFYDRQDLLGLYPINLTAVDLIEVMEEDEPNSPII